MTIDRPERWGKLQSWERKEDAVRTPPHHTTRDVPQAVRQAAQRVLDGTTVEGEWPRRAVALRDLCRAVFETDGRILGLPSGTFRERQGDLLFRGVNSFKYVRENLNGEWVGTGVISDGNYYAGSKSRLDAIHDYGFCAPFGWGWAMPYKLNPETSLIEAVQLSGISLPRFIHAVRQRLNQNIEECWLEVLYQQSHDNAFRAVLLGYDGVVDSAIDHYAIYNNRMLVYQIDCTPWAHGLEPCPEEFEETEQPNEAARPDRTYESQVESANTHLIHDIHDLPRFESDGVDNSSAIRLKYTPAANEVRREITEMRS